MRETYNVVIADNIPLSPHRQGGPVRIFKNFNYLPDDFNIFYLGCSGTHFSTKYNRIIEENIQTVKNKYIHHVLYNYFLKQNNKWLKGGSFYDTITRLILLRHRKYNKRLKELAQDADVLIASHPWTFSSLKKHAKKNTLMIYDAHNCEYQLVKERYGGPLGTLIVWWTKKIEKEACKKSDIIFACSTNEINNFKKYYDIPSKKIYIIPNSVETHNFKPFSLQQRLQAKQKNNMSKKVCLLFLATNYFPNNEAATYIVKELAQELNRCEFIIIGSVNVHFQRLNIPIPKNVHLYGQVSEEKLLELVKMCDIALNPILLGSGTNIKLIDYMSWGIPCITSARGVRGMDARNQQEVAITPRNKFKNEVFHLLKSKETYKRLREQGRAFVEKHYDSRVIAQKIADIIKKHL